MFEKLIIEEEGELLDFKQSITSLSKIAKTIVSFANTKGGKIVVGVRDDRSISGIDPEEEKYMLEKAGGFYCKPPIELQFEEQEIDDEGMERTVLIVRISESEEKPHFARTKNGEWVAYVRVKDQSIPAGTQLVKVLKSQSPVHSSPSGALTEHQKGLLAYLDTKDRITLLQFMKLKNFSKRRAQRMLTEMVISGILRVHEHEKEAYYTR